MTTKAELKKQADKLKAELTELNKRIDKMEEAPEDWDKPQFKVGDEYCYLMATAAYALDVWNGCDTDIERWRKGNAFRTKEEAELKVRQGRARARIQRHADYINKRDGRGHSGFLPGKTNYAVDYFDHKTNIFHWDKHDNYQAHEYPCFSHSASCIQHINECEADYRVLWGVE